jgi:hypothetical protein
VLNAERMENLKWIFYVQKEKEEDEMQLQLENLVNATDFIEVYELLRLFERDHFEHCVEKLRSESSVGSLYLREETLSRLRESINAKHLNKDIAKTYMRSAFMRTASDIKKNDDVMIVLYLFGAKTIHLDYKDTILHEIFQINLKQEFTRRAS